MHIGVEGVNYECLNLAFLHTAPAHAETLAGTVLMTTKPHKFRPLAKSHESHGMGGPGCGSAGVRVAKSTKVGGDRYKAIPLRK